MPIIPPFPSLDNIEWTDDELIDIGRRTVAWMAADLRERDEAAVIARRIAQANVAEQLVVGLQQENERLTTEVDRLREQIRETRTSNHPFPGTAFPPCDARDCVNHGRMRFHNVWLCDAHYATAFRFSPFCRDGLIDHGEFVTLHNGDCPCPYDPPCGA